MEILIILGFVFMFLFGIFLCTYNLFFDCSNIPITHENNDCDDLIYLSSLSDAYDQDYINYWNGD